MSREPPDSRHLVFRLLRREADGTVRELGRFASRADAEAVAKVLADEASTTWVEEVQAG